MKRFLYLFLCIPFLVACKKEDESIPANSRRIKQITMSNIANVGTTKAYYEYDNELLVNRIILVKSSTSYNTWDTMVKSSYSYSGNIVTEISFLDDDGVLALGEKTEYEFNDNRMDRMKYYEYVEGEYINRYEYFFNYNGNLLETFNYYLDVEEDGILHEISMGEYTYDNQSITRFRIKDLYSDEYFYNEDFAYENGLMDNWYSSENYRLTNHWNKLDKEEYEYDSENILQKTRRFEWHNSWSYNYSISYLYDHDNLIMEDYGVGLLKVEYEYEDAVGNSELFVFSPLDRVYNSPIIESIHNNFLKTRYNFQEKILQN